MPPPTSTNPIQWFIKLIAKNLGKCTTKTLSRKTQKCASIGNEYSEYGYADIIIQSKDYGVKKYGDTRHLWRHGNEVYNIAPEEKCYVIVYENYNYKGDSEFYGRPEDEDFFRKEVPGLFKQYKVQEAPEARTGKCDAYWDKNHKWGPYYICAAWGWDVYSLECVCLDIEHEDREEDN